MKNIARLLFVALLVVGVTIPGKAHVYVGAGESGRGSDELKQTTAGCSPSSAFEWLNINNVRTRYNAGGDMWWDLGNLGAQYFIPANGSATSLFAGALWIAGVDINNQLKCAAVRFRQGSNGKGGNDFWTGPLTLDGASIDEVTCAQWDQVWKITRAEVDEFLGHLTGPKPGEDARYGTFDDSDEHYSIPKIITDWPAHPDIVGGTTAGISHYMAPFYDNDNDGQYNPMQGDFPYYDIENELCHTKIATMDEQYEASMKGSILSDQVLKGDQTLWWVFNDKGNTHTESEGSAIGLEIRAQAFAFATNDEINNMSFCSYEIINRSTYELTGTYFCPWTDVDLGYAQDDYVGCDVARGLGYGYNGTAIDGSGEPEAYGDQPPAVGIDFFQGPYMDPDGKDNPKYIYTYDYSQFIGISPTTGDSLFFATDSTQICDVSINGVNFGNGIVDDERFGMRRFLYHNNDNSTVGDPKYAPDYYLMLQGIWKDGNKMLYGGNAYPGAEGTVGPACDFMFPGDTDPCNWGTGGNPPAEGYNENGKYWTDSEAGNKPADRRFMQSAGPFTLKPGAVNYITFGVPWARATSGGPLASVELLRVTDDKCQALFDNCFKVIDGPSAPDLTIRELDQQLIIYLSNSAISNNYRERYTEIDTEIPKSRVDTEIHWDSTLTVTPHGDSVYTVHQWEEKTETFYDRTYRFEGYKVYQLIDDEVGADELDNNAKARLIFQCDIKNGVAKLVNYAYNEQIGAIVPTLKVEGADGGITHSFVVTEDSFSTGDNPALVNHKTYYFMAVAYAYNNYMDYAQDPVQPLLLYGQQKPYLEGRKNIRCYSAVPHKIVNGTVMRCEYGQKPAVQRIVGIGNGGNEIELIDENVNELFTKKLANSYDEAGNKVVFGHPDYPIIYHPQYKVGYGPLDVKIIDPLNVKTAKYELWFDTLFEATTKDVSSNNQMKVPIDETKPISKTNNKPGSEATRMVSHWYLRDLDADTVLLSDTTTAYGDEKVFIERGISVTVNQSYGPAPVKVGYMWDNSNNAFYIAKENITPKSGLIASSFTFQDSTSVWLDGIRDNDNPPASSLNWIRSGKYYDKYDPDVSDYDMNNKSTPYDPSESFEKIAHGTWAPFYLCANENNGLVWNTKKVFPIPMRTVNTYATNYYPKLTSVDIVLTADKSKWTRCPVIEMCRDINLSENGATTWALRKAPSIDKDGNPYMYEGKPFNDWTQDTAAVHFSDNPDDPNFISPQGMGWFPGYVIDVESGARLNVIYGEDSYLSDLNGRDMMFNPPMLKKATVEELYGDASQTLDPAIYRQVGNEEVFGARHYVYILGMDKPNDIPGSLPIPKEDFCCPAYDAGAYAFNLFFQFQNMKPNLYKIAAAFLWRQVQYVGMPMGIEGTTWLEPGNDAKIRIRVSRPYEQGYSMAALDSVYADLDINDLYPKYKFAIDGLNPVLNDPDKTEDDLDLITIVPNPYYAYSTYEKNALNNTVKITNLPNNCTVTIYNLSGTKIRQFKKDNEDASIDWDLTNFANTPVASGFYLIHVKDNTSGGERTIKFFGAMRLIDLNTF